MFGVEEDDFIFGGVGGTVVGLEDISSQYNMPRIDMVFLLTVLPLDQGRIDLNLSVVGTDEATNPNVPAPYFTGPIYGKRHVAFGSSCLINPAGLQIPFLLWRVCTMSTCRDQWALSTSH